MVKSFKVLAVITIVGFTILTVCLFGIFQMLNNHAIATGYIMISVTLWVLFTLGFCNTILKVATDLWYNGPRR